VQAEADRRRTQFEKRKRGFDSERRQRRAGLTLLELHRHAVEREIRLSTVAAANPEAGRGGGSDGSVNRLGAPAGQILIGSQQLMEDDPRYEEHLRVIRSRLEGWHELLDEAEGLGATAVKTMLSEEKDREILTKGRGLSAQAVVDLLGRDITGSPETVRRVRRKNGCSAKDGELLPDPPARSGNVRRVVIDERMS
jgi:hypothetical protein